jgi:CBS domain-containing protein
VCDILARKGSQVHTIPANATVHEALVEMERHNTGALVVVTGQHVQGIFTERDHARRVALAGLDARLTPVAQVLTPQVVCVSRDAGVQEAMSLMTQQRIRHLPVVDDSGMCGVISIGDLVKSLVQEQEVEIRYLTAYISGELAL